MRIERSRIEHSFLIKFTVNCALGEVLYFQDLNLVKIQPLFLNSCILTNQSSNIIGRNFKSRKSMV